MKWRYNIYRFQGESNPSDLSLLYVMEIVNGDKGLLVEGYWVYNSDEVSGLIWEVLNHVGFKD